MKHTCIDCGNPTEIILQDLRRGGFLELVTCRTVGCLLNGVTLTAEQFADMSEANLDAYREMVSLRMIADRSES